MIVLRCPRCGGADLKPAAPLGKDFRCQACELGLNLWQVEFTILPDSPPVQSVKEWLKEVQNVGATAVQ